MALRGKNSYESSIVRRRDREISARQKWEDNAKYFMDSGIQANKYDAWAKTPAGNQAVDSMDTFKKHHEIEMKQMQIQRRRAELAKMLKDENLEYEAQLRSMSRDDLANLVRMREQVDTYRAVRDEERQQIADEKLYDHWRLNNPAIRKAESENLRQYVADSWGDQLSERREQRAVERASDAEWERRMKAAAREEAERVAAELSARRQQEVEYRESLRRQADEVVQRDAEGQLYEAEERAIMEELAVLEKLQQERKTAEMRRQQGEHGKLLKKQHAARLLRMSRQVQAELDADRMLLVDLAARQANDEDCSVERREMARADAAWMQKTIEEQIRLEKQREAELEQLYADEAEREWQKRESEWNKERMARERLMQEVLKERQQQLQEKFARLQEHQVENTQRRAELDRDLADADLESARQRLLLQRERDTQRVALEEQIAEQRAAEVSTAMAAQVEAAEEAKLADEMDDLVRIETARLRKNQGQNNSTSKQQETFAPMIQGKRVTWR